jgi:hypothetical protein
MSATADILQFELKDISPSHKLVAKETSTVSENKTVTFHSILKSFVESLTSFKETIALCLNDYEKFFGRMKEDDLVQSYVERIKRREAAIQNKVTSLNRVLYPI